VNKRVLLVTGIVIAVVVVIGVLALPVKQRCGHPNHTCATAPDEQGYIHYYYEMKPLGVSVLESLTGAVISLHYSAGTELVKSHARAAAS
jgi:hypothetical protein